MCKYLKILYIFCIFSLYSCGEESPTNPVVTSGLVGKWQGLSKLNLDGQESLQDINLEILADGSFEMTELATQRSGQGSYEIYERLGSLTLRFEKSELLHPAQVGALLDLEYELLGNELSLVSQTLVFKLKRAEVLEESDVVTGAWVCDSASDGSRWDMQLVGGSLMMYAARPGESSLFLKAAAATDLARPVSDREQWESEFGSSYLYLVEQALPLKIFDALLIMVDDLEEPTDLENQTDMDSDQVVAAKQIAWAALQLSPSQDSYSVLEPIFKCAKAR